MDAFFFFFFYERSYSLTNGPMKFGECLLSDSFLVESQENVCGKITVWIKIQTHFRALFPSFPPPPNLWPSSKSPLVVQRNGKWCASAGPLPPLPQHRACSKWTEGERQGFGVRFAGFQLRTLCFFSWVVFCGPVCVMKRPSLTLSQSGKWCQTWSQSSGLFPFSQGSPMTS